MGNFLFTITIGFILYFLYGSLVFWSVGSAVTVLFIALMFIDIEEPKQKLEDYSDSIMTKVERSLF